ENRSLALCPTRRSSELFRTARGVGRSEAQRSSAPPRGCPGKAVPSPAIGAVERARPWGGGSADRGQVRRELQAVARTGRRVRPPDRKSTRLNSSHVKIS